MKLKGILSTAIAIASGVLVLVGYFLPSLLGNIQIFIINGAVILAGFAVLVGIANLLLVHANKVRQKQKSAFYSAILIFALVVAFLIGLLAPYVPKVAPYFSYIFNAVLLPVETSLMALLAVTLTYASIRLLRRRLNLFSVIFLATVLLVLIGTASLPILGNVPLISTLIRPVITQVFAAAGARGILLGVALGTLTTGLRILLGADRPYGGN